MDSTTHTTTTVEFVDWRAKAKAKLEAEDKLFKGGRAAKSVQSYVLRTLLGFVDQEPRFAEVVCNTQRTFSECCAAVVNNAGEVLSDLETYESCLTLDDIVKYAQGDPVYGWQISQLKLYEEPLKLEDFSRHGFCGMNGTGVCGNADCENYQPSGNYMEPPTCAVNGCILYEAPQSWCYVEDAECTS